MNLFLKHRILILVVLLQISTFIKAQTVDYSSVASLLERNEMKQTLQLLKEIDTTSISVYDKATWYYYNAECLFKNDKHHLAYKNISQSKKLFAKLNEEKDLMDCNMLILDILSHQDGLNIATEPIIDKLFQYAEQEKDTPMMKDIYFNLASKFIDIDNREEALNCLNKLVEIAILQHDENGLGGSYFNISSVYSLTTPSNTDSSLYYNNKAIAVFLKYHNNQKLSYAYNNKGIIYKNKGDYDNAILYFRKADSVPLDKFVAKTKVIYYDNIADAYYSNKDYKNASRYLRKLITLQDSINDTQQNIAISGIIEKYDNEKLRADNLVSEAKSKKNRNLLYTVFALLIFSIIIGVLIYSNRIRKHKLTENEKEIEKQKVTNLLKEQELVAIDAMIEGQEKERKLIASDLHDDLGALMATLQLNFDNLNQHRDGDNVEQLFTTIKSSIKEAYQKIRSIAHVKNSGVIAEQGLLKAIENNMQKISKFNSISIEVRDYGLENRLQASLELTIFRIVQELVTNIIKHANAKQAIIHITNHKDSLNIMIEDDGKGFDTKSISKSKGMGIHSIEKRVEFLGGTMAIESISGKGTSVIIDLPLEQEE